MWATRLFVNTPWREKLDKNLPTLIVCSLVLLLICFYFWTFVLPNHPSRPKSVSKSATLIFMNFTHYWQQCWFDSSLRLDRCRIYNANGEVLTEGIFLPMDGKPAIQPDQLRIAQGGNSYSVHLANGTVLIPQQNFDEIWRQLSGDVSK